MPRSSGRIPSSAPRPLGQADRYFYLFLLIPVWLLVATEPRYLPEALKFIGPEEKTSIPIYLQFIFAHFGLDLVRMASIHTPSPFATALGLVGALLIGQIAVSVGFFTPEVLLYTGLVALGVFSTPSWELSMANRVYLLLLILLTGLFRLPGLIAGFALIFINLVTTKSFGLPYLWPLIPLNPKVLFMYSSAGPSFAVLPPPLAGDQGQRSHHERGSEAGSRRLSRGSWNNRICCQAYLQFTSHITAAL